MVVSTFNRMANFAQMARDAHRLKSSDQEHVRSTVRTHLVARMGRMRGLPQKVGQMLSFSRQNDQAHAPEQFACLQEAAEPLPLEVVRPVLESSWGRSLEEVLSEIDPNANAASLGQVHHAKTLDGTDVAVKVQYPGIRDAVKADLKLLGWLSVPVGKLQHGFDLSAYRATILEDLDCELDYRREASQQKAMSKWVTNDSSVIVPRVIGELSNDKVLVTTWHDGDHWNVVRRDWSDMHKRKLANVLLRFFLDGLLVGRMMQADWHAGNFRFRRQEDNAQVLLYDFGCYYHPSNDDRLALARLIDATVNGTESPWPLFLKLGFRPEYLEPMASKLPALCRVLFEPFCAERPYDLSHWRLGERVSDILGRDRWNFRVAGPANLVFLLRAFHGLTYYLEGLGTPVFWNKAFEPCRNALASEMSRLDIPNSTRPECEFATLAKYLKIRIRDNGKTKVQLTQYASSIDHLDELLDDDVKARIKTQGIDLPQLVADVRRQGYSPSELFQLTEGDRQIDVWLE